MKKLIIIIISIALVSYNNFEAKKVKIFMAGDSTMSIKEKKNYPETGWGMPFASFWDSTVTVVNKAKNGRSTKSFMAEGLWQQIIDEGSVGDYVIIQFGHNDEVITKKTYTTPDTFKLNLTKYIIDARSKNMQPILLTSVSRRRFDSTTGKAVETHDYSPYVRQVAAETKVPFIDADKLSIALLQQLGNQPSRVLFNQIKTGEHPNYPNGVEDNTHFNELGARLIAQLILKEIKALNIGLEERVIKMVR